MKRVFAAIVPSERAIFEISAHVDALRKGFPDIRAGWVRRENIHLTLHFAGEVDDAGLVRLQDHVETVATRTPAFDARLAEAGAFVDKRAGRSVIWVGMEELGAAGLMARAVNDIRALEGEKGKRFVPHLTLARVRGIVPVELIEANRERSLEQVQFPVGEFVVFESELRPGGPAYTVLSRHGLGRS
jgi:2'-5' RNA ligase